MINVAVNNLRITAGCEFIPLFCKLILMNKLRERPSVDVTQSNYNDNEFKMNINEYLEQLRKKKKVQKRAMSGTKI